MFFLAEEPARAILKNAPWKNMLQKIKRFIDQNKLIGKNDKILIGLSGGPDSVFLTLVILKLKNLYKAGVFACHVDHGYRKTSYKDAEFSKNFCASSGIPIAVKKIRLKKFTEEKARLMRYKIFQKAAAEFGCNKIATGHTLDDNAETVIMWLARGCGINGLSGIPARRDNIIRPVLCVAKKDILKYLKSRGIGYCVDKTNFSDAFVRNKIRNKIMPILEEINPRVKDHIFRLSGFVSNKKVDIKSKKEYNEKKAFSLDEPIAYFDADKMAAGRLEIRTRKKGDFMVPFGMSGKKKLQNIFVDRKVPREMRDAIPLVFCGDRLIWAAGVKRSDDAKVSKSTRNILKLKISAEKIAL